MLFNSETLANIDVAFIRDATKLTDVFSSSAILFGDAFETIASLHLIIYRL
jgi:hypothetical protein